MIHYKGWGLKGLSSSASHLELVRENWAPPESGRGWALQHHIWSWSGRTGPRLNLEGAEPFSIASGAGQGELDPTWVWKGLSSSASHLELVRESWTPPESGRGSALQHRIWSWSGRAGPRLSLEAVNTRLLLQPPFVPYILLLEIKFCFTKILFSKSALTKKTRWRWLGGKLSNPPEKPVWLPCHSGGKQPRDWTDWGPAFTAGVSVLEPQRACT